jgi:two-component system response regulator HydG
MQKTVLVVDDDERILTLLQETLNVAGYRALTASSGPDAMRKLTAEEIDAVITDIKMPDWDGLTLLERIKAGWPDLPVIMITAYADQDIRDRAAVGGASGFLDKPFRLDQLEKMLTETMQNASARAGATARKIETVLVVEDDDEFRQILMGLLPALGYTPREAASAEAALAILAEEHFDAVITDFVLPHMNGTELMHKIKTDSPETAVIMITGYAPSVDGHDFAGADGFLMKPFRFDEIDKLLKNLPPSK